MKVIPWSELNKVRRPKGWVWVPRPYLSKEKLDKIVKKQNPHYKTSLWSVVAEGKQKPYGQHFLIKITREDLPVLEERNMKVKVGWAQSTLLLDGNSEKTEEPDIGAIAESMQNASVTDAEEKSDNNKNLQDAADSSN